MLNKETARRYCSEDIHLIENYKKAIEDDTQVYHCHHRLGKDMSTSELKEQNLYYNRPANELIFLSAEDHLGLHNSSCIKEEKYPNVKSFQDMLNEKKLIQEKYKIWTTRNPDQKDELEKKMKQDISDLLDEFEEKERKGIKTIDKIHSLGIKINRKRIEYKH